jgi:hypothetical protein
MMRKRVHLRAYYGLQPRLAFAATTPFNRKSCQQRIQQRFLNSACSLRDEPVPSVTRSLMPLCAFRLGDEPIQSFKIHDL